jgi:hypothetical protein
MNFKKMGVSYFQLPIGVTDCLAKNFLYPLMNYSKKKRKIKNKQYGEKVDKEKTLSYR